MKEEPKRLRDLRRIEDMENRREMAARLKAQLESTRQNLAMNPVMTRATIDAVARRLKSDFARMGAAGVPVIPAMIDEAFSPLRSAIDE